MIRVTESVTAGPAYPQQEYLLDAAAGATVTLPAAMGTGFKYKFIVSTTVTSNSYIIQAASSSDVMAGVMIGANDTDASVSGWETAATSDTMTLNGTTTGGYIGDTVELVDIKEGVWAVSGIMKQTGTEATPFSAAV